MHLTKTDIQNTERIKRLNIINSITGIKPANLIGTTSNEGASNLAIFSSVIHLGSDPALIGFVLRPQHKRRSHTFENIRENGYYTINHVSSFFVEQAHFTSAKFDKEESEFKKCGLTEEYVPGFVAPFVKESRVKLGMKFLEKMPIKANDTMLIIGGIEHLIVPSDAMDKEGHIDLDRVDGVGISGLNSYYHLEKMTQFFYARPGELPDFSGNK